MMIDYKAILDDISDDVRFYKNRAFKEACKDQYLFELGPRRKRDDRLLYEILMWQRFERLIKTHIDRAKENDNESHS